MEYTRVHCASLSDVHGACQYVVPRGGIFLVSITALSQEVVDVKISVQSACSLNTGHLEDNRRYIFFPGYSLLFELNLLVCKYE
jgi:hypothetical protein